MNTDHLVINGNHLQQIFKPCQSLKKLKFIINCLDEKIDIIRLLQQFQNEWWLDIARPPVLVLRSDENKIFISSMPCTSDVSFKFSTNLNRWLLNKGRLDSPFLYFTKVRSINFVNNNEGPVTVTLLRFIRRVFRSYNQMLSFKYWKFVGSRQHLEQLLNRKTIPAVLPNVNCFDLESEDFAGIDGVTLTLWLLLAPNVRELVLSYMPMMAKMALARQLIEQYSPLLELYLQGKNEYYCFEMLPNELIFMIISYLNSPDLVQAFLGLNRRLNMIVFESTRHFNFSSKITRQWLLQSLPHVENFVETMFLDTHLIPTIFPCTYLFLNLRTIIIKYSSPFTVELNVKNYSAIGAIVSCMNVLRICRMLPSDETNKFLLFSGNFFLNNDRQALHVANSLPCPAIVRLSVEECTIQDMLSLCALTPNLTNLKISSLRSKHHHNNSSFLSAFIAQPTHLSQLHITIDEINFLSVDLITKLISSYQSSLEYVTLIVYTSKKIFDGRCLEALFQPCQHLKKLVFMLDYKTKEENILEHLYQFQSDWWLNDRQPSVFIHRNPDGHTFFCSMPCVYPLSLTVSSDLKKWLINKGNLDPRLIYFTKVEEINFVDNYKRPITLDLVHFIGRMFRSCHQELSFTCWKLVLPNEFYLEQLLNTHTMALLPNVRHLNMNSCDLDGVDVKTLLTWLLISPNVNELSLKLKSNKDRMQI
ncbi:unnamed protein product, partial [Rotaria sordida]